MNVLTHNGNDFPRHIMGDEQPQQSGPARLFPFFPLRLTIQIRHRTWIFSVCLGYDAMVYGPDGGLLGTTWGLTRASAFRAAQDLRMEMIREFIGLVA